MCACLPQDDYECVVKVLACPSWPAAFSPLRNVFELVNKVKAWLAEHEQSQGPVIVVDKCVCLNRIHFLSLSSLFSFSCKKFIMFLLLCYNLICSTALNFEGTVCNN